MEDIAEIPDAPENGNNLDEAPNQDQVPEMVLHVASSSNTTVVSWDPREEKDYCVVKVDKTAPPIGKARGNIWSYTVFGPKTRYDCATQPGCTYVICVTRYSSNDEVVAKGRVTVTAHFTINELNALMRKATIFGSRDMEEFHFLYKAKPLQYWDDLRATNDKIQKKMKDYCGQPGNPINAKIEGIFFGVTLYNGNLPDKSPFGDIRLDISAMRLLSLKTKLYFADFYCLGSVHYVTIVACQEDSMADRYCSTKLLLLQLDDNPFLMITASEEGENPKLQYFSNAEPNLWIEVFYTEDVQITAADSCTKITARDRGTSSEHGVPNDKYCTFCNLYPDKRSFY